ncbi:MAG: hypothetical protein ABSA09_05450 [Desulfobaccales bacterium]|jgi:hypothetical protein
MTYRFKPICEHTIVGPIAAIALKKYSNIGDVIIISPNCASFSEFENQINKLIAELETIKKQGKKFFEKEQK